MKHPYYSILPLISLMLLATSEPVVRRPKPASSGTDSGQRQVIIQPDIPKNICFLPPRMGDWGFVELLEDCATLDQFGDKPPFGAEAFRGSSVMICCPNPAPNRTVSVVFPGEFGSEDYDDSNYDLNFGLRAESVDQQPSPSEICHKISNETECLPIAECNSQNISDSAPPTMCAWHASSKTHHFCCTKKANDSEEDNEEEADGRDLVEDVNVRAGGLDHYDCEDHHVKCGTWASSVPESCTNPQHQAFSLMSVACMKSCNLCGEKGCSDVFPSCGKWAMSNYCWKKPQMMSFYCRETCGTCGFRSPRNSEVQEVNGRVYSEIDHDKFYCGEGKPYKEINMQHSDSISKPQNGSSTEAKGEKTVNSTEKEESTTEEDILSEELIRSTREEKENATEELKLFYYKTQSENSERGISCGAVGISDRFLLFAAHCNVQFLTTDSSHSVKTILIRDGTPFQEQVVVRRVFVHPLFRYPALYYDIAVIELSRRTLYDYDHYGDSPSCLGFGRPLENRKATSEGYGFTEHGHTSSRLLTTNVTVISNSDCARFLSGNASASNSRILHQRLRDALEDGVNEQLLCTVGDWNQTTGVYSGPCEGDSGGPLYVAHGIGGRRALTVEGIVSGGLSCGKNIPVWYTRVSAFRSWILCIIRETSVLNNKALVEEKCAKSIYKFTIRNEIVDL